MLELLSPAESAEAVIASVQSGADSIYIRFGGETEKNFSREDFIKAIRYCRLRACKVYVQLDSALHDDEMEAAVILARLAAETGADALVVQDLGLAAVLRSVLPDTPLHAGERLGFASLADCEAAAQMGFARVRLPMELSGEEIAFVCAHSKVEVEVAALGTTCFSRRNACRISAFSGGPGAGAGYCAQNCRREFSLGGRMDDEHPIALNDTCLISHLGELEKMGVTCVRIEDFGGRPERAALLSGVYSACIRETREPSPSELGQIDLAFSHRVFTDGYYTGSGEEMFGFPPPPDPDARRLLAEVRRNYENSEARRVPVKFYAMARNGGPLQIAAVDEEGNQAVFKGRRVAREGGVQLMESDVENAMFRTGGTQFACVDVKTKIEPGVCSGGDDLDAVRQRLLRELSEKRAAPARCRSREMPPRPQSRLYAGESQLIFQVLSADQLIEELAELKPDYLYVPLEVIMSDFGRLTPFMDAGATVAAVMPQIVSDPETPEVLDMLTRANGLGVREALVQSFGQVGIVRKAGLEARGGLGVSLLNSFAVALAGAAGLLSVTAPCELTAVEISRLSKPVNMEMIVYGRIPVMVSDQCVIKRSAGRCTCSAPAQLSDNKGAVYPIVREYGCRNTVLNSLKLYVPGDRAEGLWGRRLMFTTESARECVEVAKGFLGLSKYRPNGLTRGLYFKDV